jgi:histidinol-phosphatase
MPAAEGGADPTATSHPGPVAYGPTWSASFARASEAELEGWLAFALATCDAADAIALEHFRRDLVIATKPDRTFVTEADRAIERLIRERIGLAYPDHGLVGEEYGSEGGHGSARWYIDPIDGTHNFMRGIPLFGTLLSLEVEGELQVGVVSAPAFGERWYARRGGGAWAEDLVRGTGVRRAAVSRVEALEDAHLLYGSGRDVADSGAAPGFDRLLRAAWRERGFGDFWGYALVAEGAAEAMIEAGLKPWDIAAPLIVIEEAGGLVTDFGGHRSVEMATFLASNGLLHRELLQRLADEG